MIGLVLCAAFCATPAEADALRATAPAYLTVESAAEHIRAAREAALVTGTDPALLLAIAWHESRYDPRVVTREPGHRVSCGVMTPVPKRGCRGDELTLEGGYLAGARHLREWLDIRHSLRRAVVAYAGAGWRAEKFGREMIARAARIRRALADARGAS